MNSTELDAQLAVLAAHLDQAGGLIDSTHPGKAPVIDAIALLAALRRDLAKTPTMTARLLGLDGKTLTLDMTHVEHYQLNIDHDIVEKPGGHSFVEHTYGEMSTVTLIARVHRAGTISYDRGDSTEADPA